MIIENLFGNLFAILVGTLIFLTGLLFFAFAMKRNSEVAGNFIYAIFAGIVAGIVAAMLLEVRQRGGDSLDYYLMLSLGMFLIGLVVLIMTPKRLRKK